MNSFENLLTEDVLRTLVLDVHLLGVERIMIVAHTDCRMSGCLYDVTTGKVEVAVPA